MAEAVLGLQPIFLLDTSWCHYEISIRLQFIFKKKKEKKKAASSTSSKKILSAADLGISIKVATKAALGVSGCRWRVKDGSFSLSPSTELSVCDP